MVVPAGETAAVHQPCDETRLCGCGFNGWLQHAAQTSRPFMELSREGTLNKPLVS